MSIIAHLRRVSSDQIKGFERNPSSAYDLILGRSLSSVRKTSQEVQGWKARNALTLLKATQAGKRENLNPEDRLLFDKAHHELTDISRNAVLQGMASLQQSAPRERSLCLERSWQGIHYLLTGVTEGGSPPVSWAVHGDREIPDREKLPGYTPARFLTPKQVKSVSEALTVFTRDRFLKGFNRKKTAAAKIYAMKGEEDREYFWAYFQKLKAYYSQAAKKSNGMLGYFD